MYIQQKQYNKPHELNKSNYVLQGYISPICMLLNNQKSSTYGLKKSIHYKQWLARWIIGRM